MTPAQAALAEAAALETARVHSRPCREWKPARQPPRLVLPGRGPAPLHDIAELVLAVSGHHLPDNPQSTVDEPVNTCGQSDVAARRHNLTTIPTADPARPAPAAATTEEVA